jgi:glutaredoxin
MKGLIITLIFVLGLGNVSYAQVAENSLNDKLTIQENSQKIIIYGSDTCHYCIDTKKHLKEKNVDFIYYDVDINLLKQREMLVKLRNAGISTDYLSLPVADLKGQLIMNSSNFDEFLKKLTLKK